MKRFRFAGLALVLLAVACDGDGAGRDSGAAEVAPSRDVAAHDVAEGYAGPACEEEGTPGATAGCLRPTREPDYYVEQALRYFDTLDIDADPESRPDYAEHVARWEWPPWLLLTGLGRSNLIETAAILRQFDPSTVPERDCRFFDVQPFARCYVVFAYEGGPCPIYEEFVFNDAGEMTFIEAWSDLPGLRPTSDEDRWGEHSDIGRLSTRLPGLGHGDGRALPDNPRLQTAAADDPDIAEYAERAADFWATWLAEYQNADEDFFARGCGW